MSGMIILPQDPKRIGPALAELRELLGLKQVDMIEAGVGNQGVVSDFERGCTTPQSPTILKYLAALGYQLAAAPLPDEEGT